jgi:dihydrofolate reductase
MRPICYNVAMSLDGYIAGPNGESDWIVVDPEIDFQALMNSFDTLLMGRRTFEAARTGGGGMTPGMNVVVVSRTLRSSDHPGITILADNLKDSVTRLRAAPGKDIWLFGGGALCGSLLNLGLVNTIGVAVIPVVLGGGIPLMSPTLQRTRLRLLASRTYKKTGTVSLEYAVET